MLSVANQSKKKERGVALVIVIFVVTLASIIVLELTWSTFLGSRRRAIVMKSVEAEFILKSAVNVAQTLITADTTEGDDPKDPWYPFRNGIPVPGEMIGIENPGVVISLEIRSQGAKFPLITLVNAGSAGVQVVARDRLVRLFEKLGFDQPDPNQEQGTTPSQKFFNAKEMVANLIDYIDADEESYAPTDTFPQGIEGELPKDEPFPNKKLERTEELLNVPGFTPLRVRKLLPYVQTVSDFRAGNYGVNINAAPELILSILSSQMSDSNVTDIITFRNTTPFGVDLSQQLTQVVGDSIARDIMQQSQVGYYSSTYSVIAKVDMGIQSYYARAQVSKNGTTEPAEISSLELF